MFRHALHNGNTLFFSIGFQLVTTGTLTWTPPLFPFGNSREVPFRRLPQGSLSAIGHQRDSVNEEEVNYGSI